MSRTRFAASLIRDPGSVLDIGCRDGELSQYLPGPYAGADLKPGPHVRYAGDIAAMEIHEQFDTVFALDILEHLEHPSVVFDRLVPLARKQIVVSFPNCYDLQSRWKFLNGHLGGKYLFLEQEPVDRHRWLMNRAEIIAWLTEKARRHNLNLQVHDMAYGASGHKTATGITGRILAKVLPASLSTVTVFGVFTR